MIQPGKREQLLGPEVPVSWGQVAFGGVRWVLGVPRCNPGDSTGSLHTWTGSQCSHLRDWDFPSPRAWCTFKTCAEEGRMWLLSGGTAHFCLSTPRLSSFPSIKCSSLCPLPVWALC